MMETWTAAERLAYRKAQAQEEKWRARQRCMAFRDAMGQERAAMWQVNTMATHIGEWFIDTDGCMTRIIGGST
jgi:hypothetical protein